MNRNRTFGRSFRYILVLYLILHHRKVKIMTAFVPIIKGFEFDISVEFYRQGEFVLAYSPDLDLSSYADSVDDAKASFQDALSIFLTETLEKGTFFSELQSLGWEIKLVPSPEFIKPTKRPDNTSRSEIINHAMIPVSIPIHAYAH
ncbi:MAG TPA: hypothetical protein PLR30_15525 [Saprospiraceae bacterium]|nr:hypothetical protein [Saprospiraceae bacterium]